MYEEQNIPKLDPLAHIRLRPGMYIGGIDERALHHLVYETVDNAVDEYLAGRCDHIWITLRDDNEVVIRDNGSGVPVHAVEEGGQSWLEIFMTMVGFVNGKLYQEHFGRKPYSVSGGLHGVGVAAVNALSAELTAEVARDGYLWRQTYKEGLPQHPVTQIRPLTQDEATGTTLTFKPDFSIFEQHNFSHKKLVQRSREMAWLLKNLRITLRDERVHPAVENTYYSPDGLVDYLRDLNRKRTVLHAVVSASHTTTIRPENREPYDIIVDFAFQYTDNRVKDERSFINTVRTPQGGTHASALRDALVSVMTIEILKDYPDVAVTKGQVLAGITAIVSVQHPQPSFVGPMTVELANPEVYDVIFGVVFDRFSAFLGENRLIAKRLVQKCVANRHTNQT